MKLKNKKTVGLIALLVAVIIAIGLFGFSCVSGAAAIGWSGGTVADNILYVGANEGRLAAFNLTDDSTQWAEALKPVTQTGLFGCSPYVGCGGGTATVGIYGTPAVSGDLVYIAGYNGKIYAYNTNNLASGGSIRAKAIFSRSSAGWSSRRASCLSAVPTASCTLWMPPPAT